MSIMGHAIRMLSSGQELRKTVVDTGGPEVGLAMEGLPQVMRPMSSIVHELHDGENEIIRLVQGIKDLVSRNCDGLGPTDAALDLNKPQLA